MSYDEAFADLSTSVLGLLAADPPTTATLGGDELAAVLTARDTVVAEVRQIVRGLLAATPAASADLALRHLVTDPAHVLYDALTQLDDAAPTDRPADLASAGSSTEAGPADSWRTAARQAVLLERYHDWLPDLDGPKAWAALWDVAELAGSVPYLDADLTAAVPGSWSKAHAALQAPVPHQLLLLSSQQLRQQLRRFPPQPIPRHAREHRDRVPARPTLLRSPRDLPDGMRQLSWVLGALGPTVAAVDARSVAGLLAVGVEQLGKHARGAGPPAEQAAAAVAGAVPSLRQVVTGNIATLSPRDARVTVLCAEIARQLNQPGRQPPGPLLAWAATAPSLASALEKALERSLHGQQMFVRPGERASPVEERLLWVPTSAFTGDQHQVLDAARAARHTLWHARPAVHTALAATGAEPEARAVRAAGRAAGQAAEQLRVALAARPAPTGIQPDLPGMPRSASQDRTRGRGRASAEHTTPGRHSEDFTQEVAALVQAPGLADERCRGSARREEPDETLRRSTGPAATGSWARPELVGALRQLGNAGVATAENADPCPRPAGR